MNDIMEIIRTISYFIEILLLLAAGLGFFFKGWISEWIKARFSRAVGQELEVHKHQLSRELEAYKSTLIHDLEQKKASIDIKRTIALKMADARLDALRVLHAALSDMSTAACTWPVYPQGIRTIAHGEYMLKIDALKVAISHASIFLPNPLRVEIANANGQALRLATSFPVGSANSLNGNDPQIVSLMTMYSTASRQIEDLILEEPRTI